MVLSQQAYLPRRVESPTLSAQQPALDPAQEELLALLRTKGLSVKDLDEGKRAELRELMDLLHNGRGLSLNDIAKLIGNKTSGYTSWLCRRLGVERRPFDGTDEDRAYLLGLRHGDLSVSRPWNGVVRVSTSTTHPAMVRLFRSLFEPYGHVYQDPRYKKDTKTYEWNLCTIVDESFEFLFVDIHAVWDRVSMKESTLLAYIAGVLDAEGSVGIWSNKAGTALQLQFYNTRMELLVFIKGALERLGYDPLGPYLDKEKGTTTSKYKITRKKDYRKIALAIFDQVQDVLRILPIRHAEKTQRRDIALSVELGQPWTSVEHRVVALRTSIRSERDAFIAMAEREYLRRHHSTRISEGRQAVGTGP